MKRIKNYNVLKQIYEEFNEPVQDVEMLNSINASDKFGIFHYLVSIGFINQLDETFANTEIGKSYTISATGIEYIEKFEILKKNRIRANIAIIVSIVGLVISLIGLL
ncbi:hypothetical protein SAMN05661096_01039 [Marivirga sericea]|uniref:Uncharacterized protein n=1 Tax=Marivirga sericea TaxID=1028 RepID=A0A1X7ITF6_9BACT|nr:hypothetical protein [Marivirga sericea]SMG18212.1 hypothetical protein SAMN05661096_01039 [Marivirga sericea]